MPATSQPSLFGLLSRYRQKELLTLQEAAELLDVSVTSVRQLKELGKLKGPDYVISTASERQPRVFLVSVLAYVAESTPHFDADDFDDLLTTFVEHAGRTPLACERLIALATARRRRL